MILIQEAVLALVFVLCVYLVFAPCYRTGFFGALGLVLILGMAAVTLLSGWLEASEPFMPVLFPMPRATFVMILGFLLFLAQHVFRAVFHARRERREAAVPLPFGGTPRFVGKGATHGS